jgi:NADPH:quinone reductase-like Zn-dependent oxidoreductase
MKAIVCRGFGPPDVLELRDVGKPAPADDEISIRVRATTVTAGDCEFRRMDFPIYLRIPLRVYAGLRSRNGTILGQELAGEVESVGGEVTGFTPGDRVFGATLFRFGAYAEYASLPETHPIAQIPDGVSYEEAATIPVGGVNGLHFLRKANVRAGDSVLINGAGGSIGTYAVQVAKSTGAEVTAVDSAGKLDVLRSIGADHVVDYTQEDFTRRGETYDAIVDVVGTSSFSRSVRCLERNGRYVLGNPRLPGVVRALWTTTVTDKRVAFEPANPRPGDLEHLAGLVQSGGVRPVVDRRYPLERVADAHRYVESGRKTGNVVVTME